jgi:hypothetical protein
MEAYERCLRMQSKAAHFTAAELEVRILVQTEKAKVLATLAEKEKAAKAYQTALAWFEHEKATLPDQSIAFPILSGLLLAIKWGAITDDNEGTYEQSLVRAFIDSAKAHGNTAHISRALALEGVMFQNLGNFAAAVDSQLELERYYTTHDSKEITASYGSDRGAQSYPLSIQWMWITDGGAGDRVHQQIKTSRALLASVEMEERNLHNTFMMLYPLVCVFVEMEMEADALALWKTHILEPFKKHYSDDAVLFFSFAYEPIWVFLELRLAYRGTTKANLKLLSIAEPMLSRLIGGERPWKPVHEKSMSLLGRGIEGIHAEMGALYLAISTSGDKSGCSAREAGDDDSSSKKKMLTWCNEVLDSSEKRATCKGLRWELAAVQNTKLLVSELEPI